MSYPASIKKLKDVLDVVDGTANRIKATAIDIRDRSASGPVNRIEVAQFKKFLRDAVNDWNTAAAVPGIVQYARDQKDDQTIDVVLEFTNMVNAATTLADWIHANTPTDAGSGAVLETVRNSDGTSTNLTYSSAQMTDFRTNVDTFVATIS